MNPEHIQVISFSGGMLSAWFSRTLADGLAVRRPAYLSGEGDKLVFSALERAIGKADLAYLRGQPCETGDLRRHARASRKRFVRLYLKQRSARFQASAQVARQLAADADAPELAFAVARQTLRFRLLSAALRLSLIFEPLMPLARLATRLNRPFSSPAGSNVSTRQPAG